ncbi:metal-transporting ATPase [Corynebacterium yudongzhengii]|uniref:Cation-transporting P-type ATPase n=1 Tax=Corynebacterium yudongzhengii TaxID=2080740 RepID=A0A2U1T9M1_9CORY|nr:HAD family hydrolase [Corynebacterium yudongzhengii]AWB81167.1 metal-transporting ATPase [Corynebacterium yudongzhengii]PWC02706.1 cation-transporting P-type ATPase [Corynebacterium yudongzhengii]
MPSPKAHGADSVSSAIDAARTAAVEAGLHTGFTPEGYDPASRRSYTFELSGLPEAPDVGEIEDALEVIDGVSARIIHPSATAYLTAPATVNLARITACLERFGVSAVLTDASLRRRQLTEHPTAQGRKVRGKNMSWATRRHAEEEHAAQQRLRRAGFLSEAPRRPVDVDDGDDDVLYTARSLVSVARLIVAVVCTVPVLALSYVLEWQFDGWQWWALAFSVPVVTYSAWPFTRALAGGVRRGLTALDGASALAIWLAVLWSAGVMLLTDVGEPGWSSRPSWFAFDNRGVIEGELFLDVACVMTVVLLAGRLATIRARTSLLAQMERVRPDPNLEVEVTRSRRPGHRHAAAGEPEMLPLGEINVGDDVVVKAGQIIPVDGPVIGGSCTTAPNLVAAADETTGTAKVGTYVYAGTRNVEGRIKVRVERTGHQTRMAAIHRWVEEASHRQNRATMLSTKTASFLIPSAVVVAMLDFLTWYLITGNLNASIATALAVLASVAPVALALSPALAIRHGIEAAARHGVMVRDGSAIRTLDSVDTVIFNRLGTLTTNDVRVESIAVEHGENPELILRVAAALMVESDHPASQAVVRAARISRDRDAGDDDCLPRWLEATSIAIDDNGTFTGVVELPGASGRSSEGGSRRIEVRVWRPRTMSEVSGRIAAAVVSGGTPLVVSWQGSDRGVITLLDTVRDDATDAVDAIEDQGIETIMISRDAYPVSRRLADRIGVDQVLAGIAPGQKPRVVRSVHTQGRTVAMVGDATVVQTMAAADIGVLNGSTAALELGSGGDHLGIGAVVLREEVSAVARLIAHARRICRIIDGNIYFSWGYNILAIAAACAGVLNPMAATILMVASSAVIEARSRSARRFRRV